MSISRSKIINNIIIFTCIVLFSFVFSLSSIKNVDATPVIGFNPGYIIDDSIFVNSNSMTVNQIQDFLNSKASNCDTNGTQPASDFNRPDITHAQYAAEQIQAAQAAGRTTNWTNPPYICLKDYVENDIKSAQLIYNLAQQYQINPQVLIVLLQKEQGLVTDTWPLPIQYKTATGYGCPDTAPCDSQYFGLTNQLTWSSKMFRAILNDSPTWYSPYVVGNNFIHYSPIASCGGSIVNIQNRSTQALYDYTPYQPSQAALDAGYGLVNCGAYGNRNFYLYFTSWFGIINYDKIQPLFKAVGSNTVYAIIRDTKYEIQSPEIIKAYGLKNYAATSVTDTFMSSFATGTPITSVIAKKQNDNSGTLYLFDDGKRYPINISACLNNPDGSAVINSSWKIDCFNSDIALTLPNEFIDNYTVQDITIPNMIISDKSVWKIENGKKRRITDPAFVSVLGGWGVVREMQQINASQTQGKMIIRNESLVKFNDSPNIYLISNDKLYPVTSQAEINAWKLNTKVAYNFPANYNTPDPLEVSVDSLKQFAIDSKNIQYILFPNGTKASLQGSGTTLLPSQYSQLPDSLLNNIPSIALPQLFRSDSGSIFIIQNNELFLFPTINDIINSGYPITQIQQVSKTIENTFPYAGLKMANGRLFKVTGSDAIRYVYGDSSLTVNSTKLTELPYDKIITVDTTTGNLYPITGTYNTPEIFRSESGSIFTVQNNKRYIFPTINDIIGYGFSMNQIQQVSNSTENSFTYGGLKMANGRLFKVTGSDAIRYVYRDRISMLVPSTKIDSLPYDKIITVDSTTGTIYPIVGVYSIK